MESVSDVLEFSVEAIPYDDGYTVADSTRATTNFANLARDPATRQRNIATFLDLVNADLNLLLGDPTARYQIRLDVVTISCHVVGDPAEDSIPLTEVMRAAVRDSQSGAIHEGPIGLNFSSYLRDYDFRVVLPDLLRRQASAAEMNDFGAVHGMLTRAQFGPDGVIPQPLTVAISISQRGEYEATGHMHPILGREYHSVSESLTDKYFLRMGLKPQFFRPRILPAPIAFYSADPICDHTDFYLAALVSVMANFQRIYRPEIYLARTPFSDIPGTHSTASLTNADYARPAIYYDRNEREVLADMQARLISERLLMPHADAINRLKGLAGQERASETGKFGHDLERRAGTSPVGFLSRGSAERGRRHPRPGTSGR